MLPLSMPVGAHDALVSVHFDLQQLPYLQCLPSLKIYASFIQVIYLVPLYPVLPGNLAGSLYECAALHCSKKISFSHFIY